MRELRFRAWDRIKRKMLYGVSPFNVHITDENEPLLSLEYSKHDDCEFEQYTGLKDKNDKEIYEGDIVEEDIDFNSKMTDGTFRYRVYWDECLLCWALDPIGRESIHDELWQTNLSRRVIGNIHENPELLGDTNVTNKEEE
jgi:uncharacterized phage protein (TIGR01671 family)